MIIKRDDGTYSGDYVFKGEQKITREVLERSLVRVKTLLAINHLNGEITTTDELRRLYRERLERFFTVPVMGTVIRIYSVEIIDDEQDIGLRIVFKPRFSGVESEDYRHDLIKYIETNQLTLIPRMIGSKHGEIIDVCDIVTFDLVPREGAEVDL